MIQNIKLFLKKYNLQDKIIIVGFSGGYDSMCLLDILSKIKKDTEFLNMKIIAAHFNHNWRGEESLKEQEVCRLFALSRDVEFYTETAGPNIKKTENDARIARYEFFENAVDEYNADAVFTAHNKDDNAETVLYRIIKGTGIVGLSGIAEKRNIFYRPLLKTSRAEILQYCTKNNLEPNNDSSNQNTKYQRNYIRLNLIPMMQKINENVKDALNTLANVASADNKIIEEYLQTIRPNIFKNRGIVPDEYKKLSEPVKLRLLHEYIQFIGLDYDYKKVMEIYNFIEKNIQHKNGSTISLATALWLYADNKVIETIPKKGETIQERIEQPVIIDQEGSFYFSGREFTIKPFKKDKIFLFPEETSNFAYVDLSNKNSDINFPLTLRHRQDGDIISPFGMSGTMKFKKYLNAKGIARHNRDNLILLCSDNEVLWAIGVGISNKISVKSEPTHVIEIK